MSQGLARYIAKRLGFAGLMLVAAQVRQRLGLDR
jgi:hypothetical protein